MKCVPVALIAPVAAQKDPKTQRLAGLAKKNNDFIKLTANTYRQFTEGKGNHGIVVLLTAPNDYFE